MSQKNVEVVQAQWEAWSRVDIDAVLETCDPAVEWDARKFDGWPDDDVYHGHAGFRRFLEEWRSIWDRLEAGVEEYIDAPADRLLVLCWNQGYGRESHVPMRVDFAVLYTFRDGLVWRLEPYSDRQEARKAAGLVD